MSDYTQWLSFKEESISEEFDLPEWLFEDAETPEYSQADINKYLAAGKKHKNKLKKVFSNVDVIIDALSDHVLVINPGQMSFRKLTKQGMPTGAVLSGKKYSVGLWQGKQQVNNHKWTWNIDIKSGKLPEPAFIDDIGKRDWQDPVVGRLLLSYLLAHFKPASKKFFFNFSSNTSNLQAEDKAANALDEAIMQAVIDNNGKGITIEVGGTKFKNVMGLAQLDLGSKRGRYGKEEKADFVLYSGKRSLTLEQKLDTAICYISHKAENYGAWFTGQAIFKSDFRSKIKEIDKVMKNLEQLNADLGEPEKYLQSAHGAWSMPVKSKDLVTMLTYGKDYETKQFGRNFVNVVAIGNPKLRGSKGNYKLSFAREYAYPKAPSGPDALCWVVGNAHPRAPTYMRVGSLSLRILPQKLGVVKKSKPF